MVALFEKAGSGLRDRLLCACFGFALFAANTPSSGADGFWILGPNLELTGQPSWIPYNAGDAPEGAFMGWVTSGFAKTEGLVDLKRTLAAGKYYVLIKVIDYFGNGKIKVAAGGGSATVDTVDRDWNRYWTEPLVIQAGQSFSMLNITLVKTLPITDDQKYLLRGLYITTNPNENVALYGLDRIVNWKYPTATNIPRQTGRNLIENASFEIGLGHGWGFLAEGYERQQASTPLLVADDAARYGSHCVRFPSNGNLISRTYTLRPNTNYTLTAWVRSDTPSGLGMGITSRATPPPGFPAAQRLYQNFPTTTSWQRISVSGFLPAYPNSDYQVIIDGRPGACIDAVQLEEGGRSEFKPHASIEIGFASDKPGRILFEDESPALNLLSFNGSTEAFSGTLVYEIYDIFNQKVLTQERPLSVAPSAGSVESLDLPSKRGIFRVVAWVKGVEGTLEEVVYDVVPRPRLQGLDESSIIGVHPNLLPFELAMHERLGFKWARAMSPEAIFRWSLIEPVEGQITWCDDKVNAASPHGVTILGTIGTNNYWPSWANENGLPNLDKWESFVERLVTHYKGRVKYWEIWNEPIYNFTAEFYAQLLMRAATAIRRADPDAKIVGMGGVYDQKWIVKVMDVLGDNWKQYLDYISTHLYPPDTDPSGGETEGSAVIFKREVIDRYNIEVWNTETGVWDEGFYKTANSGFAPMGEAMWPYLDSERYVHGSYYEPERLLANLVHCVGNGLTKYFYYDSRIYLDPSFQRTHPTMLEYDDSIRSKGIAYSIAGYFLDGSRGLGDISPASGTTYAYLFDRGGKPTVVIWSKDKLKHSLQLAPADWRAFDMMGNEIIVTNGTVPFGRTPVYIQSALLPPDAARLAFQAATISNLSDTQPPNLSIDEFPTGPVEQPVNLRWLGIDETSIPSAISPNAVTYSFKLEGRDADWSPWTPTTRVSLASTPSGEYTFQVRARDAAGNISAIESRKIAIKSPAPAPPKRLRLVK